jgi:uncharacterized protein
MNRTLLSVALLLSLCGTAAAQQAPGDQPATKEDIQRYLEVMHSKEMMAQMMDAMAKPMHQMLHEQYLKEKDKLPADFEERTAKLIDEYMTSFPWEQIMDSMVPVYQKYLTKNDVDALVAFYSTPTGQKIIKELPQITAEAMQSMMPLLQKNMAELTQRVQDEVAAMEKDSQKNETKAPQKNN